jgi:hypothetical protein
MQVNESETFVQQVDKLLKPHFIALEYLLPMAVVPAELKQLLAQVSRSDCVTGDMKEHALSLKEKFLR